MSYFLNCFIIIVGIFNNNILCHVDISPPKVTFPDGRTLIGTFMKTDNGNTFRSFRGIPYAEPPIGSIRFKPPVPAKKWSGEQLAIEDGNACLSQNPFLRQFDTVGDEDCLYLNVYTPQVGQNHDPLSVMVYFHGGGWVSGSSSSRIYGPQKLLDFNVILVTVNYRIGALGFLSTGTKECPGNNGLKDQVVSLKWVQDNIKVFGGNPDDVTIFGESAGGASVGHHIYSPLSKGLFHKAILQSGTNFEVWALSDINQIIGRTKKLGALLGCPENDSNWKSFIECLRLKPAVEIVSTFKEFFVFDIEPTMMFAPVVEPETEGAFLTKHPRDVETPPSHDAPIIIGLNTDEGLLKSLALIDLVKDDFVENFNMALPQLLYYCHYPKNVQEKITEKIDSFYFKGKHDWSLEDHQNLTNLLTDSYFTWGMDKFLRKRFATNSSTTYIYLLDHRGPKTLADIFHKVPGYHGVCHGDDVIYIFTNPMHLVKGNENDDKMKWAMPLMWSNFAKTGNPTPNTTEISDWKACDKFPLEYARIGRKTDENWTLISNEVGLFEDRVEFWRGLEKIWS